MVGPVVYHERSLGGRPFQTRECVGRLVSHLFPNCSIWMTSMSLSQPDVHVGIVTALPVECAAVRLVVDDLSDRRMPGDPNHYLMGRLPGKEMGRAHRVVMAMQTQDGTRNAAAICTDLIRSFP